MNHTMLRDLTAYEVDPVRGFLPADDPLERLPAYYDAWERAAGDVAALLMTGKMRVAMDRLPLLDIDRLEDERQLNRAMLLLSVFGNGYIWMTEPAAKRLPRSLAIPWWQVAEKLGRPPIAAHASMVIHNWRRLDKSGPIDLDNLATLQIFLGGMDEQWFYLDTTVIEAKGAPALLLMIEMQEAVAAGNADLIAANLQKMAYVMAEMLTTLDRMREKCDPYIFYTRVRPYVTGWEDPGVVYEGISETPLKYSGGSAAQSALIQALDAGLGVSHRDGETSPFLLLMRTYMPPPHRKFIEALEDGPSVRQFVLDRRESHPALADAYNTCIDLLSTFRKRHMEIAVRYITHQAANEEAAKGTGGTNFVTFLSTANKETRSQVIKPENTPAGTGED